MSDSTSNLDLISPSQAQKEVTANALFDAASPAMLYGRRAVTTAGLTWGYYGGYLMASGALVGVANGTVALAASTTNYVEANPDTGVVTANTAGFTAGKVPLYEIVTGAGSVTSYIDRRAVALAGAADASLSAHVAAADPHPQYLRQVEADALYDAAGAAAAAVTAHEGAGDPHPQYLTPAEAGALFDAGGAAAAAVDAHEAEVNPHPQYLTAIPAQPFDLTAFYPGLIPASALVTRVPFARAVSFLAALAGSQGRASVAATAQTDFDVQQNGVSVGTIRFAADSATASFIAASPVNFAAGDVVSIIAPSTPDATLSNVGIVLAGTR